MEIQIEIQSACPFCDRDLKLMGNKANIQAHINRCEEKQKEIKTKKKKIVDKNTQQISLFFKNKPNGNIQIHFHYFCKQNFN